MKYVLDTNALSALMKANPAVMRRLQEVAKSDVCVPQPVIAEIEYGIRRLPQSRRRKALAERFSLVMRELARCPWNDAVSAHFGTVKAQLERSGHPREDFDIAIAAHALATNAVLVTADGDYDSIAGLAVEDWDEPQ